MRYCILILLLFVSLPVLTPQVMAQQSGPVQSTLIRDITLEGFVLGDKDRFEKIFKPYRNKYLTTSDTDGILKKIQKIYEEEGYQQLVAISYEVVKGRLVFTVLMTS